eukprot:TRINITY_DN66461_c0_g1_i1.p1 TRINITY_DN66461_c0_g1~~TRINITY_DN66461_c0_g1_i1.p1  ORF type:complete len:481 (+),score=131.09 TRINITY_DN66461_c0_g1_i1:112-1443(+)
MEYAERESLRVVELEPLDIFNVKFESGDRAVGIHASGLCTDSPGVALLKHIDCILQDTEMHLTLHEFLTTGIPPGWILMATARSLQDIPDFILSRFTYAVEQGLPSYSLRHAILTEAFASTGIACDADQVSEVVSWLSGRLGGIGREDLRRVIPRFVRRLQSGSGFEGVREEYARINDTSIAFRLRTADVSIPSVRWSDILGHGDTIARLRTALSLYRLDAGQRDALALTPCRGVLLYGLPGNGKTLLAKAVATELGATFLLGSIPSLLKGYVGESERMVRELFAKARQNTPCCVFLDEIQAVFGDREEEGGSAGGHDSRIVSQLLSELDHVPDGVFVLAATNTPAVLDSALLSPGRLDLHIHVPPPTAQERLMYLQAHCSEGVASAEEMSRVAVSLQCFTYSDLASLVNVAALKGSLRYAVGACQASFTPDMLQSLVAWRQG